MKTYLWNPLLETNPAIVVSNFIAVLAAFPLWIPSNVTYKIEVKVAGLQSLILF